MQQDDLRKELFPANPPAEEQEVALDGTFSVHNPENQSLDLEL